MVSTMSFSSATLFSGSKRRKSLANAFAGPSSNTVNPHQRTNTASTINSVGSTRASFSASVGKASATLEEDEDAYYAPPSSLPSSRRPSAATTILSVFSNPFSSSNSSSQETFAGSASTDSKIDTRMSLDQIHFPANASGSASSRLKKHEGGRRPSLFKAWRARRGSPQQQQQQQQQASLQSQALSEDHSYAEPLVRRGSLASTVMFGQTSDQYEAPSALRTARAGSLSLAAEVLRRDSNQGIWTQGWQLEQPDIRAALPPSPSKAIGLDAELDSFQARADAQFQTDRVPKLKSSAVSLSLTEEIALYLPENQESTAPTPPPKPWQEASHEQQHPYHVQQLGPHAQYPRQMTVASSSSSLKTPTRSTTPWSWQSPGIPSGIVDDEDDRRHSLAQSDESGFLDPAFEITSPAEQTAYEDVLWRTPQWNGFGGPSMNGTSPFGLAQPGDDDCSPTRATFPPHQEHEAFHHDHLHEASHDTVGPNGSADDLSTPRLVGGAMARFPSDPGHEQELDGEHGYVDTHCPPYRTSSDSRYSALSSPSSPSFLPPTPVAHSRLPDASRGLMPDSDGKHLEPTNVQSGLTAHANNSVESLSKQFCSVLLLDLGNGTAVPMSPSPNTERPDPFSTFRTHGFTA
ncbi:hypothetical protein BCV70DRAFT_39343 [Testicularia cyperi]|uniref:Uncharacterized protein n=1 Tax=Testicularia cyperi TaxID=1882483 RepID=A0A317XJQ0_9BASI|nr:hypothetical protein BCV70DRAFT_39343 [Testicularia cyperi]